MKDMNIEDVNTASKQSTPNDLTIDATGPSPEENDECINRHAQDLQRLISSWLQQRRSITTAGRQSFFTAEVQKKVKSIERRCNELGKQHLECLKKLSDNGWFLSPDTPVEQLRTLADSLDANTSFAEGAIRSYFRKRIDSIESELAEAYPRRSRILHDAFEAHGEGRYTLSVPVFLCQADGIWRDRFRKNFFQPRNRKNTLQDCKNDPQLQYVVTMLTLRNVSINLRQLSSRN